jgi:cytochrome P450 family 13
MLTFVFTIIAIVFTLFGIYYLYAYNNAYYWQRRGVPGPISKNYFINFLEDLLNPNYNGCFLYRDWTKQYGPVYGLLEGSRKILVVADLKLAQDILVKEFEKFHARKVGALVPDMNKDKGVDVFLASGSRWKRLRTIMNPCFSVNNLKALIPIMDDSCKVMMEFLEKPVKTKKPFDISKYYHELTMDVICRIAVGQRGTKQFDNPNVEIIKGILSRKGVEWLDDLAHMFPALGPYFFKFLLGFLVKFINLPGFHLMESIKKSIEEKKIEKANGITANTDFIGIFIDAEADSIKDEAFTKTSMKIEKKMNIEETVMNCFLFLIAGYDTTANTLAIVTWYLIQYPEIQEQLYDEIESCCPDDECTYDQLNQLKLCEAIIKEALRLNPIGTLVVSRRCVEPTTLGKIPIEKGTYVQVDVMSLHYDKKIWGENAEEFYPERFYDLSIEQQMAYFSFGAGPRICIGMRLTLMEQKLAFVKILKKYKMKKCSETANECKLVGSVILGPENVMVEFESRQ